MQVDPLPFLHADVVSAGAIDIVALPHGMIRGYPRIPAVQQLPLPDLLVTEEFPAACGAVDGDH